MDEHAARLQRIKRLCSHLDKQVDTAHELKARLLELRRETQRLILDLSRPGQ